jgi:membrane protein DedA with SNARE-associated domain
MAHLHQIISFVGQFAISLTSFLGYWGIFVLMIMESMIIPIPSEAVLPFAGFLAQSGEMNYWLIVIFATIGSLVGSLISYAMGFYGGNAIIKKWGKYFFLDEEDLIKTEKWFGKQGELTIFIGRFVPVVRHLISIPAGVGKMNLKKFCLYTVLGAGIWNGFLIYAGMLLGQHWDNVKGYMEYISIAMVVLIVLAIVYFVFKHIKKKRGK